MTQQTNPKRHKHADLIHAWAEGTEIQFLNSIDQWVDIEGAPCWHKDHQYRIKPKLVKKWKWVAKSPWHSPVEYIITSEYYSSEEEFSKKGSGGSGWTAIQKVDSTEIEVEETS